MNKNLVMLIRIPPFYGRKYSHPQDVLLPFTIAYAATGLSKEGFEVEIADLWARHGEPDELVERIRTRGPALVCIESTTSSAPATHNIARRIKAETGSLVAAMGQDAFTRPETYLEPGDADWAVSCEPDGAVPELALCLRDGADPADIPGLCMLRDGKTVSTGDRPLIEDMDSMDMVDYSLLELGRYRKKSIHVPVLGPVRWGFMLTSRGCPYDCIFCSPTLRQSLGKRFRAMGPERVAAEVEALVKKFNRNAVSFEDDVFAHDRERVVGICRELGGLDLDFKWVAQVRLDSLDEPTLAAMAEAGCSGVCAGIESGSDRILELLQKGITVAEIKKRAALVRRFGLDMTLFFMIGSPTETWDEVRQTMLLARELKPTMIQVAFFTPYPGSRAFEAVSREAGVDSISHYNELGFNPSAMDDETLKKALSRFYLGFYLSPVSVGRYLVRRAPYAVSDLSDLKLAWETARFFLAKP